ncbi:nuclear cap-binding protein subunit 3-like [Denticeps clupeoides]|uniref:Nuclear cap-binding protein subunit 3 n=1 Tax=Denticeps clupeoides TaxID=299321 RepID=A0A8C4G8V0_9TELE|nr:nuclear cap-binding protein subunit 3-like [Denticeps clupeoides]
MAAVRSIRVSVKSDSASDRSDSDADSDVDPRSEPMEVEEGELELEDITVRRSLKELLPDTRRRYENKAGTFITGIDVTSKEALEKKEKRARRFHFRAEADLVKRNVVLDRDLIRKAIPKVRLEALHLSGVDDMSTQEVFGYFKDYPPAHIEWIDDASCNVVWLDDVTSARALLNMSTMPEETAAGDSSKDTQLVQEEKEAQESHRSDYEEEEGEVDEKDKKNNEEDKPEMTEVERESLLRNDFRPATKSFKGNKLFLRFSTQDDKKELGAARRSRYYMKYGNPNYGGMKGILSNSWKRRYHTRRIQRDVLKTKKSLIGDSMGLTPPYSHRHSADLVNLPEEPIEEEEEEGEEMDADERVVEYQSEGDRGHGGVGSLRSHPTRSSSASSDSDEMDYDLELKMISAPSPKKSMKMSMYADEVETQLRNLRNASRSEDASVWNRIGDGTKPEKMVDVRQLLEEKRHGPSQSTSPLTSTSGKTGVRQRLGKRPHSPESRRSSSPHTRRSPAHRHEPVTGVHSRLGVSKPDACALYSDTDKDKKRGLWSRLGSAHSDAKQKSSSRLKHTGSSGQQCEEHEASQFRDDEEEESRLQKVWGAMISQKKQQSSQMKKSRLDNLPSLQIEVSRDSSNGSDSES